MVGDSNVTKSNFFEEARSSLRNGREKGLGNFYTFEPLLRSSLRFWLSPEVLAQNEGLLEGVGEEAAGVLNSWAIETNRDENLPRLRSHDAYGNRTEEVVFHPLYHEMGRRIYKSGIMSLYGTPGQELLQMALYSLFTHNGESGHCCPLACTAGAIKLISRVASEEVRRKFLPRLLDSSYDSHYHAAQFLTEIQGGSDVGANQTRAVRDKDGRWRLHGEKWFCSVADAHVWVLTAREDGAPDGTRGLSTFVALRHLETGAVNHFTVRRLKTKLGTRSMATAEIDLQGTEAYAVGQSGEGFKYVVDIVLNTSRLYNGFGCAGMIRRAYGEALQFARLRSCFGKPILNFPLVKRALCQLKTETACVLTSCFQLAALDAKMAAGEADEADRKEFRFLVNANKYWTSIQATKRIRQAIEVFGGNGTIEEFSVLPRLYRDAIVYESWEGTHNVLCQQVLRDMAKLKVHDVILERNEAHLKELDTHSECGDISRRYLAKLSALRQQASQVLSMEEEDAQLHIRTWIDNLMPTIQGVGLLRESVKEPDRHLRLQKILLVHYQLLQLVERVDQFANQDTSALERRIET